MAVKPIQVYLPRQTTTKHVPRDTHAQCSVRSQRAQNRAKSRSAEHAAGGRQRVGDSPTGAILLTSSQTELRTWGSHGASSKKSNGWARRLCSLTLT
ncbi:unnamed protein product [Rangifer tarandus platyrhynchus]|uniref:Uncharacterized protein n=1 Tax=Rangifer tarandus platyrhynchus TaxID=3082113 RepID=A0ABN8Y553_RANTA|nr:unnamed protein product [Rangifer tarandus platyrhynchus]